MKTWIAFVAVVLACSAASVALARPSTPPPKTGVITPLTGDRDSAPSASPATSPAAGCQANPVGSVLVNGASTPAPHAAAGGNGVRSAATPVIVNGAAVPGAASAPGSGWCGGRTPRRRGRTSGLPTDDGQQDGRARALPSSARHAGPDSMP